MHRAEFACSESLDTASDNLRGLQLQDFMSFFACRTAHILQIICVAVAWLLFALAIPAQARAPRINQKNAHNGLGRDPQAKASYIGSEACSHCHLGIARSFAAASMGHSLTEITPKFLKTLSLPASYTDPNTHHSYSVYAQDGRLWQSEFQSTPGGEPPSNSASPEQDIFRSTHPIQWIIGTGENGYGGLLTRGGYLFQAPLSYYSAAGKWQLSPGYEHADYGFNRIIQPGCIYCHSGRPQPVSGYDGKYENQPFAHVSIGCENCHGPGSVHLDAMDLGEEVKGRDNTIVNPARLTRELSDNICMSCHEIGDARVLEQGKTYQDFRPGQPLSQTLSVFNVAPTRQNPPDEDHLEHYSSMTLSKCYRASLGKLPAQQMRCITCHDPHVEPTHAEAPAYFNAKCMQCHTQTSCTKPIALRRATTPADNCIGCHMPRRPITTISHSSATNHRILARPGEPLPDAIFQQASPEMPQLIDLDAPSGHPLPSLRTRMLADRILMDKRSADERVGFDADWRSALVKLEQTDAEDAQVQTNLGHRDLLDQQFSNAIVHLQHALQLDRLQPEAWVDLSASQSKLGMTDAAIASAQQAVALDPYVAPLQKTLITRLIDAQQYDQAVNAMKQYLTHFPEDDFIRKALAIAEQ